MGKANTLCPICQEQKPVPDQAPFCSKRCKLVDLNRWVSGTYAVPTEEAPTPEELQATVTSSERG